MQRLHQLIKKVDLDADGVFKYIQIRLRPTAVNKDLQPVIVVRGYLDCEYHADILAKFRINELEQDEELSSQW